MTVESALTFFHDELPLDLGAPVEDLTVEVICQGGTRSKAVLRLTAEGMPPKILKIDETDELYSLREESVRQRWASERLPVPRVTGFASREGHDYLLMEMLDGTPLHDARHGLEQREVVRRTAEALRLLHSLDPGTCPFDERLDVKLARVTEIVRRGLLDSSNFDDANQRRAPEDILEELIATRPPDEDLVVSHGDAYIENILTNPLGIIDVGILGVSNRYVDLGVAARSLFYTLGQDWTAELMADYGIPAPDPVRIAYYQLLDELY